MCQHGRILCGSDKNSDDESMEAFTNYMDTRQSQSYKLKKIQKFLFYHFCKINNTYLLKLLDTMQNMKLFCKKT